MYGTGRVRFSAQQAEFETINYAAELAGTIHFTDNIRNEVLLGASRVIRTLASSPNIRTFFDQNFANPVFIADPGLEYSTLPPASTIDDKGVYLFNRLNFYAVVPVLAGVRKSDYKTIGRAHV